MFASVWESKKIITSPLALLAPAIRARIRPDRSVEIWTIVISVNSNSTKIFLYLRDE